jgi:hypothetical protein
MSIVFEPAMMRATREKFVVRVKFDNGNSARVEVTALNAVMAAACVLKVFGGGELLSVTPKKGRAQ